MKPIVEHGDWVGTRALRNTTDAVFTQRVPCAYSNTSYHNITLVIGGRPAGLSDKVVYHQYIKRVTSECLEGSPEKVRGMTLLRQLGSDTEHQLISCSDRVTAVHEYCRNPTEKTMRAVREQFPSLLVGSVQSLGSMAIDLRNHRRYKLVHDDNPTSLRERHAWLISKRFHQAVTRAAAHPVSPVPLFKFKWREDLACYVVDRNDTPILLVFSDRVVLPRNWEEAIRAYASAMTTRSCSVCGVGYSFHHAATTVHANTILRVFKAGLPSLTPQGRSLEKFTVPRGRYVPPPGVVVASHWSVTL